MHTLPSHTRRHSLIGLWFAVLALCALNLQSLQHYQRMLVEDALCSVDSSGVSGAVSKGKASHHDAACALGCAQVQAAVPVAWLSPAGAFAARMELVAPATLGSPTTRPWPTGQPRGPPQPA